MRIRLTLLFLVAAVSLAAAGVASAALQAFGPVDLSNGFPLWYQDSNGLKVELCLDPQVLAPDGKTFAPCLVRPPIPSLPISFPFNFAAEQTYWSADAIKTFQSTQNGATFLDPNGLPFNGSVLAVLALQASFTTPDVGPLQQAVIARIKLRARVPVPGTYRITHPFGSFDYVVTPVVDPLVPPDDRRLINALQDVGALAPLDFSVALRDGPTANLDGTVSVVDFNNRSIGPFLIPAAGPGSAPTPRVLAANGDEYLAIPQAIISGVFARNELSVTGGLQGQNFLKIELIRDQTGGPPPVGFALNGADGTNVVQVDTFVVQGKVFDDRPNLPPGAADDTAATLAGVPVMIDVLANDVDVTDRQAATPTNVHGINPQAVAFGAAAPFVTTATTLTPFKTPHGKAERVVNVSTGRASVRYTPDPGFVGVDKFPYVVQDAGGLVSAPATVTVAVEDLRVSSTGLRVKLWKWDIAGTSTLTAGPNVITIHAGPDLTGPVIGTATVEASPSGSGPGLWVLKRKPRFGPGPTRSISIVSSSGASVLNIPLTIR